MNAKPPSFKPPSFKPRSFKHFSLPVLATPPPRIARAVMGFTALITIAWLQLTPPCLAEDITNSAPSPSAPSPSAPSPSASSPSASSDDTQLTREQWQQRVEAARERLRQQRTNGLGLRPATTTERARDQDNTERAMSDDSLQPGDMVSTPKGLMTFKGAKTQSGEPGQPADPLRKPEENFIPAVR
jgi:hypothetical protein